MGQTVDLYLPSTANPSGGGQRTNNGLWLGVPVTGQADAAAAVVTMYQGGTALSGSNGLPVTMTTLLAGEDQTNNRLLVTGPNEWMLNSAAAVNTAAGVVKAAVGGVRHLARSISWSLVVGNAAAAPLAAPSSIVVLDGVTVIWQLTMNVTAVVGMTLAFTASGLNWPNTLGASMTFGYLAASGANTFQTVSLSGIDLAN